MYNTNVGGEEEVCYNNNPSANCPKHGCEYSCEPKNSTIKTGVGYSFQDCHDDLKIGVIECNSCPQPSPTPPPPPPWDCDYDLCTSYGPNYCYDTRFAKCVQVSPIVIDVLGNGFNLTDGNNGVDFDFKGNGRPYRAAWTSVNSDDAWLALDRDGNGTIDNGQELFGNLTEQPKPLDGEERNGFLALAEFDKTENGGNGDGIIGRQDDVFSSLRLWQDTNHNGISEADELKTMPELGLRKIELDYKKSRRTDEHGNKFRYRAKVKDTRDAQLGRWAWDVFPVAQQP